MFWFSKLCLTSQIGILWTLWYWLLKCMKNLKNPPACVIYQMLWCTGDTKDVLADGSQTAPDCFLFPVPLLQTDKAERSNALNTAIDSMCKRTRDLRRQVRPGQMKVQKGLEGFFSNLLFSVDVFWKEYFLFHNKNMLTTIAHSTEYLHPSFQNSGRKPCQMILAEYICMSACLNIFAVDILQ